MASTPKKKRKTRSSNKTSGIEYDNNDLTSRCFSVIFLATSRASQLSLVTYIGHACLPVKHQFWANCLHLTSPKCKCTTIDLFVAGEIHQQLSPCRLGRCVKASQT
jgi:hypothetical protein